MLLDATGSTVFVEDALGYSREDVDHGIDAILLRLLREVHDAQAVGQEFSVEEFVHQVELHDYVHQTDELAGPVPQGVHVVSLK